MTFRQGLFDIFDSRKYLRELTPEAEKALLQKLRDKIGLSPFDFQDKAFNEHDTSRVRNYSGFKLQIGEDKENTFDKLMRGKESEKEKVKRNLKRYSKRRFL